MPYERKARGDDPSPNPASTARRRHAETKKVKDQLGERGGKRKRTPSPYDDDEEVSDVPDEMLMLPIRAKKLAGSASLSKSPTKHHQPNAKASMNTTQPQHNITPLKTDDDNSASLPNLPPPPPSHPRPKRQRQRQHSALPIRPLSSATTSRPGSKALFSTPDPVPTIPHPISSTSHPSSGLPYRAKPAVLDADNAPMPLPQHDEDTPLQERLKDIDLRIQKLDQERTSLIAAQNLRAQTRALVLESQRIDARTALLQAEAQSAWEKREAEDSKPTELLRKSRADQAEVAEALQDIRRQREQ